MAFKLCLKAILLFLVVQDSEEQDVVPCNFKNNCDVSTSSVAKITCEHVYGAASPACTCDQVDVVDLTAQDYSTFDSATCKKFCKENAQCAFWKYTDLIIENEKKCYLMNKDECTKLDPDRTCPKYHKNDEHTPECISDKTEEENNFTCDEGTAPPDSQTCPGPITPTENPDEKLYVQKWECFNPDQDAEEFVVDMYDEAATMPVGGWCELVVDDDGGSCKSPKEFRFDCILDDQKGTWTKGSGIEEADAAGVIVEDKLKDVTCTASNLQFRTSDLATQTGRKIVCSKGGIMEDAASPGDFFIPAENYCHMFCDGYDVLSFYTDWNSDAAVEKRGWFYKVSDNDPVPSNDADFLNCWGKHF